MWCGQLYLSVPTPFFFNPLQPNKVYNMNRIQVCWTPHEEEFVKKYYKEFGPVWISKKIDRSIPAIEQRARKMKIKRRAIYTKNIDYFQSPSIRNSFYAGFIAADGCIVKSSSSLVIEIASKDKGILESFVRDLNYTGVFYEHYRNRSHIARLEISSSKICSDLLNNFSITPRKTFTLKPPKLTEDKYIAAFIFGFFFGDGSLLRDPRWGGSYIWTITNNKYMITWVKEVLLRLCPELNDNTVGKTRNSFRIKWGGIQVEKIQGVLAKSVGGLDKLPFIMERKIIQ